MTAAKIAITLPPQQLERVRLAVREGRASSVSAYISRALEQQGREESLAEVLRDMVREHGKPSPEDQAWALGVLARRARG